jgi:hypothetical protein
MAGFSFVNGVFTFSGRPSSHLNLGCLKAMVDELLSTGGLNPVEYEILITYANKTAHAIASMMMQVNHLKANKVDVCHKIPIHSFQLALCKVMNEQFKLKGTFNEKRWKHLVKLYIEVRSNCVGAPSADIKALFDAIHSNNTHKACSLAWVICLAFDSSHNNLFFGFAVTNHSIGQHGDMHYDIYSTLACPPTPRGPSMESRLMKLEQTLGLKVTTSFIETDSTGVHWETNSGVEGRRSQGSGSVETTRT